MKLDPDVILMDVQMPVKDGLVAAREIATLGRACLCRASAAARASRVVPTPPVPVSVTMRARRNSRLTSASSRSRPTKLVSGTGKASPATGLRCCLVGKSPRGSYTQPEFVERL
jgi:CheY-like chemotaxis protein